MYGFVVCVSCMKSPEYEQKDVEKCLVWPCVYIFTLFAYHNGCCVNVISTPNCIGHTNAPDSCHMNYSDAILFHVCLCSLFFSSNVLIFSLCLCFLCGLFLLFLLEFGWAFSLNLLSRLYEHKNHINSHSKWSWLEINDRL